MITLNTLAGKHGTDKSSHGFIGHYEFLFENFREETLNLLEIGVFMGSSIRMWDEYFINGKIFGLDSFDGVQGNGTTFDGYLSFYNDWEKSGNPKIELIKCNQSKEDELINFKNRCNSNNTKFKIIIDDGSHLMRDQQITFAHFFGLVESGGYYIIEDSHTSDDLTGYDLLPDFSNSTKKIFIDYKDTNILSTPYINDQELLNSINNQIEYVENYVSVNKVSQTLVIKKK